MVIKISYAIALLTGLGLIFIGARFMVAPEVAEAGFGIQFNEQGDFSFHYIKGIRDIFSGLVIIILVLIHQRRALGLLALASAIIPMTDMLIVLSKDYNGIAQATPHITAIVIALTLGIIFLTNKTSANNRA